MSLSLSLSLSLFLSLSRLILLPEKPQEQVFDLMHFAEIQEVSVGVEINISSIIDIDIVPIVTPFSV
jgi:hypothetical protein